ncbi:MAG: alcohol dehydrogenase catalytic domain-containing protein [Myxococcota bacterium]
MLAVRFDSKRVSVGEKPRPKGPGVLVRVRGCGICGSDVAMLDSGFPVTGTPGHEISGELADGTPVAIEPIAPCGCCRYCETGNYQVCVHGPAMVYGVGKDGGMAEEILVEPRCIVPLPRSVDARIGFLVEPLAVAVHGVRRAGLHGGQRVLVVGGGAIGLSAVAAALAAKAHVALVARHPAQIAAGRLLGAEIVESGAGGDYDVVLECADSASAVATACEAIRPNGTLLMLASSWGSLELPGLVVAAKGSTSSSPPCTAAPAVSATSTPPPSSSASAARRSRRPSSATDSRSRRRKRPSRWREIGRPARSRSCSSPERRASEPTRLRHFCSSSSRRSPSMRARTTPDSRSSATAWSTGAICPC